MTSVSSSESVPLRPRCSVTQGQMVHVAPCSSSQSLWHLHVIHLQCQGVNVVCYFSKLRNWSKGKKLQFLEGFTSLFQEVRVSPTPVPLHNQSNHDDVEANNGAETCFKSAGKKATTPSTPTFLPPDHKLGRRKIWEWFSQNALQKMSKKRGHTDGDGHSFIKRSYSVFKYLKHVKCVQIFKPLQDSFTTSSWDFLK